jgi:hypothetical protein
MEDNVKIELKPEDRQILREFTEAVNKLGIALAGMAQLAKATNALAEAATKAGT